MGDSPQNGTLMFHLKTVGSLVRNCIQNLNFLEGHAPRLPSRQGHGNHQCLAHQLPPSSTKSLVRNPVEKICKGEMEYLLVLGGMCTEHHQGWSRGMSVEG